MEDNTAQDFLNWKLKKNTKRFRSNEYTKWKGKSTEMLRREEKELIDSLKEDYENFESNRAECFNDFPLTDKTKGGLADCQFVKPTAIQKASILPALKGNDVLGAAKTGSGKTLAFLVPILECLFRHQFNSADGPGALIISPSRELALQTFEVLCKVGRKHEFSAGLIIGGKDVKEEAERVCRTNIVVCTPGRLLQHLDCTSYFSLENLKMLVLDEADRILDLGFSATVNAIIDNLPTDRQTLLFSATQTSSVKDLARLSLSNPVYISVHAESKHCTPKGLVQRYVVCPLHEKINLLFSFVRTHLKTKTLVFVSSCKQVQFLFAAFSMLRPGMPVMHLHGNMNLKRRLSVFKEFSSKHYALMFSTDLASRGLDFPDVHWVVQMDCPEDAETYIHRVGRTARFHGDGNALLMLLPSEVGMLEELAAKNVPIEKSQINTSKLTRINERLQSFCAKKQDLREQAKRCFVAYYKSIHVMKNKSIFNVKELPAAEFSSSLGLAIPPRVRFLQRLEKRKAERNRKKATFEKEAESISKTEKSSGLGDFLDDNADLFSVKRVSNKDLEKKFLSAGLAEDKPIEVNTSKASKRKKAKIATNLLRKGHAHNQKITFDDSGRAYKEDGTAVDDSDDGGLDIDKARDLMKKRDAEDRKEERRKLKEKRLARKLKAQKKLAKDSGEKFQVELGGGDEQDEDDMQDGSDTDNDAEGSDGDSQEDTGDSSADESNTAIIPSKRRKVTSSNRDETRASSLHDPVLSLEEQERLALRLMGQ